MDSSCYNFFIFGNFIYIFFHRLIYLKIGNGDEDLVF
jgi:hypothetical protein